MKTDRASPGKIILCVFLALFILSTQHPATLAAGTPSIAASGAIVVDYDTGEVYYEKNADVARPAASMTKVMSVYLVFEEIAAGRLSLDSYVTASSYAASISRNASFSGLEYLTAGQSYTVDTLLRLILTASCNGSVIVLAEHIGGGSEAVFVQRMNDKAAEWGINAHYADCCGFKDNGNAVSPRAMAYVAKRIIQDYPEVLNYTSLKSTTFQGKTFNSTNLLLRNGTVLGIDGLKTGTTSGAGYCFTGTAKQNGARIISVVMHTTSYNARMSESKKLLEYGFRCRAAKEKQWTRAANQFSISVEADAGVIYPYADNVLTAKVSNAGSGISIPCTTEWVINGTPTEVSQSGFSVANGAVLSAHYTPTAGTKALEISIKFTFPNGMTTDRAVKLPVSQENLSFSGYLSVQDVTLYPDASITVPCHITCTQGVAVTTPSGWYLDGAPIPGYQNAAFRYKPDAYSRITIDASEMSAGEHRLEFRCNLNGMPGIEQTALSCKILVLAEPETLDEPIQNAA